MHVDAPAGMAALVSDEMLHAMAVVGAPDEVADRIRDRFGSVVDRVALNTPYALDPDIARGIAASLRGGSRRTR